MQSHNHRLSTLKLLFGVFATSLLFSSSVRAEATPTLGAPAYEQTVRSLYQQIQAVERKTHNPQRSREATQRLHALFDAPVIKIPFRSVTEEGAQRQIVGSGAIYFARGDLFITQDASPARSAKSSDVEESFATINGQLYAWKSGSQTGEILKRFPNDTIAFLFYRIDPSFIMEAIYREYLKAPQNFNVSEQGGVKRLMFRQVQSGGFAGILLRENPFWLSGIIGQDSASPNAKQTVWEIDPPIPLQQLPAHLKQLPRGVHFAPSPATLENRMVYL